MKKIYPVFILLFLFATLLLKGIAAIPIERYTVTATSGEGGSVSPELTEDVTHGQQITFMLTPDNGYVVRNVLVNGECQGALESLSLNIYEDTEVEAFFIRKGEMEMYRVEIDLEMNGSYIVSTKMDGSERIVLYRNSYFAYDMEVDFRNGYLYTGILGEGLIKAKTDGTQQEVLIPDPSIGFGVGLDIYDELIYYYSRADSVIYKANLDGSGTTAFIKTYYGDHEKDGVYCIQVNKALNKLYWSEYETGLVIGADLETAETDTIITVPGTPGVFVSEVTGKVYLGMWNHYQVAQVNLDGSDFEILADSVSAYSMSVDLKSNSLIWGNSYFGFGDESDFYFAVLSLDLDTKNITEIIETAQMPFIIALPTAAKDPVLPEDGLYVFSKLDFFLSGYVFDDIQSILVQSVPAKGALFLDANNDSIADPGEIVSVSQSLSSTELSSGNLMYRPEPNEFGNPYSSFSFDVYDGAEYLELRYEKDITVVPVNDLTVISGLPSDTLYYQCGKEGSLGIISGLAIEDIDDTSFPSAMVWFHDGYVAGEDSLFYAGEGMVNTLWDEEKGMLVIDEELALADMQNILSEIHYTNRLELATEEPRGFSVCVIDGDTSNVLSRGLRVGSKYQQSLSCDHPGSLTYGDPDVEMPEFTSLGLEIEYSSSDPEIVAFEGNTMKIMAAGTATITASQPGNDTVMAAEPVEHELVVEKASQSIQFEVLTAVYDNDNPFQLGAFASSGLPVSYTSSDPDVASVSENTVTILGSGVTTITARQEGNGNYLPAGEVSQDLTVYSTVGMNPEDVGLSYYPNPAADMLHIQLHGDIEELRLVDLAGNVVKMISMPEASLQIDVSTLSQGIYFLSIQTGEKTVIEKVVVRR